MKRSVLASIFVFLLVLSGCAKISSQDIKTSGICANITASNDANNKVNVTTYLTAGCGLSASYVSLGSGESLATNYQSQYTTLSKHTDFLTNIVSYSATTNLSYQAGGLVTVMLTRPTDYVSAPDSYVYLPSTFTISSPSPGTSYSSGGTVSATWSGSGSDSVKFDLKCLEDSTNNQVNVTYTSSPASSPYSISMTALNSIVNSPNNTSGHISYCSGSLSVIRSATGTPDPALDSSSVIRGKYTASVDSLIMTF